MSPGGPFSLAKTSRVLFLAPLKVPDHPVASGERSVARAIIAALAAAGFQPELASRLRMLDRTGDESLTRNLAIQAREEAEAIIRNERARGSAAAVAVVTYHCFYKAPDVIGPRVARALGLPYLIAEASRAPRRARGLWRLGHELAEQAIDAADLILLMNEADRAMLERFRPSHQRLVSFPPFLCLADWPAPHPACRADPGSDAPARLLAVAMMRGGDKLASYRLLAQALARLPDRPWTLDIAGGGPARQAVEAAFESLSGRVRWHGLVENTLSLAPLYSAADLLVWPAVNEAFGMVFLEAATQECPALAGDFGGVRAMVQDGVTGRVVPGGDAGHFARALCSLLDNRDGLRQMGQRARLFVSEERSLERAALILRSAIEAIIPAGRPS